MSHHFLLNRGYRGERIYIGSGYKPQIIAEAGVLTFGDKKVGFQFVDEAVKAGIRLLKFQSFIPEHVVSRLDPFWLKRLRQRALSHENFIEIMRYAKRKGIVCFASTHNEYDSIKLANQGMPIIKIGSGDSNNIRMIDMSLATKKPIIVSLGLRTEKEIYRIIKRYKHFTHQIIFLHCTTEYPTPPERAHLGFIIHLAKKFPEFHFGYSDHTIGKNIAFAAALLPAVHIIEKHFCLPSHRIESKFSSYDIPSALIAEEFKQLLDFINDAWKALQPFSHKKEIFKNRNWASKAIYVRNSIAKGKRIGSTDLMSIRPYLPSKGHISIEGIYNYIGKKTKKTIPKDTYLLKSYIDQ